MLVCLFVLLAVSLVSPYKTDGGGDECEFTRDCRKLKKCIGIQDAGCICNFGKCVIDGSGFRPGDECNTYKDCECKNNPDYCYCRSGKCKSEKKFECHKSNDCKKMAKCKGKKCNCSGNLCEYDCSTTQDCIKGKFDCSESVGYKCKCEESLCGYEKLPSECEEIEDCVEKGKCTADKGCSCVNNQCVKPWYENRPFRAKFPNKNCQRDDDCDYHFVQCKVGKCKCDNVVEVDEYSSWGECVLKDQGGYNKDQGGYNKNQGGYNKNKGGFNKNKGGYNKNQDGYN